MLGTGGSDMTRWAIFRVAEGEIGSAWGFSELGEAAGELSSESSVSGVRGDVPSS